MNNQNKKKDNEIYGADENFRGSLMHA